MGTPQLQFVLAMAKLPFVFALFAMLPLVFAEINIKKIKDDTPVYYALVTGFLPFCNFFFVGRFHLTFILVNYSENPSQYVNKNRFYFCLIL